MTFHIVDVERQERICTVISGFHAVFLAVQESVGIGQHYIARQSNKHMKKTQKDWHTIGFFPEQIIENISAQQQKC